MAVQGGAHPPADVLKAFGLGKLNDRSFGAVLDHLDQCEDCRKQVAALSGDDFLNRLRQARGRSVTPAPANALSKQALGEKRSVSQHEVVNLPSELANNPQYEILRELGRGGMGVVYLAKNKLMDRLEVLKVVNKSLLDHPGTVERFLREIRSAAKLNHANVVMAYSAVQMSELLVFAMEYVEGEDLASLVKSHGPLPIQHACHYVQQAAMGLQHAFEKGMVHRDIKPQNLILTREDKKHVVKVLDFGLAKVMREKSEDTGLTGEGKMLGTPDYIAPEQTLDAAKADIRADIYSLGCTLYYLLSGHPPFSANSLGAILLAHQTKEAKPLNLVRPDVPEGLAVVVRKMMAKSPATRYQTPLEVVQALLPFVKASAKPDVKRDSTPVAAPPEKGTMIGAEIRQAKKVLRDAADKASPNKVPARGEGASSIANWWTHAAAAPKEVEQASEEARPSRPTWWKRPGVQAVAVGVSLALILMAGIVIKMLLPKQATVRLEKIETTESQEPEKTIVAGSQPDSKAGLGAVQGNQQPAPANPTLPEGGGGAIGNPRVQIPWPGIPPIQLPPGGRPFNPPNDALVLDISGVTDANIREAISEELKALAQGAGISSWNTSQGDRMRVSLWPVNDVHAFARKLDFGTVNVNGRTITVMVHDEQWPSSRAGAVTKALNQLKLPNAHKRHVALLKLKNTLLIERRAEVVTALEPLLDDADFITRKLAIKALGAWGNEKVVPILLEAMQDKVTRGEAMQALGRLKDERAVEPIAQRLEDISDLHEAAEALKQMGPVAEKAVLARLHHRNLLVRTTVCDILGAIGTQQSIPPLEKVAAAGKDIRTGQNHIVAERAVEAIVAIKARLGDAAIGNKPPNPKPSSHAGLTVSVRPSAIEMKSSGYKQEVIWTFAETEGVGVSITSRKGEWRTSDGHTIEIAKPQRMQPPLRIEKRGGKNWPDNIFVSEKVIKAARDGIAILHQEFQGKDDKGNPVSGKALLKFQIMVILYPVSAKMLMERSIGVLYAKGDLDGAIDAYRQAIKLKPDFAEAYVNIGCALNAQGKHVEAEAAFRKAIKLEPLFPEAYVNLGAALDDQEKHVEAEAAYRKAISLYRKAISIKPDYALAYHNLGVVLRRQGKHVEAEAAFRKAIELKPDDALAYNNLGVVLDAQGKHVEAEAAFRKAIVLKPDFPEAYVNLGAALEDQEKHVEAEAVFRKAIEVKPDYAEAHCNLGLVLRHLGRFADSLAALRRGDELGRKRPSWEQPSPRWVREAERLLKLDEQLSGVLKGKASPANPEDRLFLADICSRHKRLYGWAARLAAGAFNDKPSLAEDLTTNNRYNASCAAALAGCGKGKDASELDEKERARWRRQALDWLRADFDLLRKQLSSADAKTTSIVLEKLRHWQKDADFTGVRDDKSLAELPEAERRDWRRLWEEVALVGGDLAKSLVGSDLAKLAEMAKHPLLKELFHTLAVPHDQLLFKPTSGVMVSGKPQKQREDNVEPFPLYLGDEPNRLGDERMRFRPFTEDWKPDKPCSLDPLRLASVRPYEEIAQDKVRLFLRENYDGLSRSDMLKAAEQVLSSVLRWHESAIQTGKRKGKEWEDVEKRLRQMLDEVLLEQRKIPR